MVNILHDGRAETVGTETSLLGPFYREKSTLKQLGEQISSNPQTEEICMFGRVLDQDGQPVAGASVEVWQTDPDGAYDLQSMDPSTMDWRGQFRTRRAWPATGSAPPCHSATPSRWTARWDA